MLDAKKPLQVVTAVLGLVPVTTGVISMLGQQDPVYTAVALPPFPLLDSNLRFFGGLWLGLGLAIFWMIPTIERQTVLFRAIWVPIFAGGIGRLLSMLIAGLPPPRRSSPLPRWRSSALHCSSTGNSGSRAHMQVP